MNKEGEELRVGVASHFPSLTFVRPLAAWKDGDRHQEPPQRHRGVYAQGVVCEGVGRKGGGCSQRAPATEGCSSSGRGRRRGTKVEDNREARLDLRYVSCCGMCGRALRVRLNCRSVASFRSFRRQKRKPVVAHVRHPSQDRYRLSRHERKGQVVVQISTEGSGWGELQLQFCRVNRS